LYLMIRQSDIAVRSVVGRQPSGRDGAGNGSTGVRERAGNVAGNSRVATESDAVNVSNPSPKMPVAWVTHESPIQKKFRVPVPAVTSVSILIGDPLCSVFVPLCAARRCDAC